jgi:hypothetical protein
LKKGVFVFHEGEFAVFVDVKQVGVEDVAYTGLGFRV